jgi:hypothetical protein
LVGAFIHRMPGVTLDPVPADVVLAERCIEPFPEIHVLHRLLVGGPPAVAFPAVDPLRDAVMHIFAVGVQFDRAWLLQCLERGNRRHQLHAVVGGMSLAAAQLLLVIAKGQDRAPAARTRIARAGAIGVDYDVGTAGHARAP